jgi:hypothetical protein
MMKQGGTAESKFEAPAFASSLRRGRRSSKSEFHPPKVYPPSAAPEATRAGKNSNHQNHNSLKEIKGQDRNPSRGFACGLGGLPFRLCR